MRYDRNEVLHLPCSQPCNRFDAKHYKETFYLAKAELKLLRSILRQRRITGGMSDGDTPHYRGHRDRLRARFTDVGGEALPDYELLELVLFRSIPAGT
jgi:hypothetical protein